MILHVGLLIVMASLALLNAHGKGPMLTLRFLAAVLIMVFVTAPGNSGDTGEMMPIDNEQLIGVWHWQWEMGVWCTPRRSCAARYEFTKDGKIRSSDNMEGTYELAGKTLKVNLGGKTVAWTIIRLDATEFVTEVGKMPIVNGDDAWRMRRFGKK